MLLLEAISFVPKHKLCKLCLSVLGLAVICLIFRALTEINSVSYLHNPYRKDHNGFDLDVKRPWKSMEWQDIDKDVLGATEQFTTMIDASRIPGEMRAEVTWRRCRKVYPNSTQLRNQLFDFEKRSFIAHKKNFMYCAIGKTGTSNWKRVIKYLISDEKKEDELRNDYPHWLPFFEDNVLYRLTPQNQNWILTRYYKIVFVRDPLKRAISAYRDKFLGDAFDVFHGHYKRVIAKGICEMLKGYLESEPNYTDVRSLGLNCTTLYPKFSLKGFLTWLYILPLKGGIFKRDRDHFNPHWCPMIPLCSICNSSFQYDYIGRLENMEDDVSDLFSLLKLNFTFPNISDTIVSETMKTKVQLEEAELDQSFLAEIYKILNKERYVLGYSDKLYNDGDDHYLAS